MRDGLKGARIGILRQAYERDTTDPEIVEVFMAAVEDLKRAGATIVDPSRVELDGVKRVQGGGSCGGFKCDINRYLAAHGDRVPVHTLEQVFSPTTGWPAIQVPMGYTRGTLPAGITFFGRAWSEPTLIRLAYAYEQATHYRHPPASVPPLR